MLPRPAPQFNPLAAKAATISLSSFGAGGPFNFDFFSEKWGKQKKKSGKRDNSSKVKQPRASTKSSHCCIYRILIYGILYYSYIVSAK